MWRGRVFVIRQALLDSSITKFPEWEAYDDHDLAVCFTNADKVATLAKGPEWYGYLSKHFSHGRVADWRGLSWQGGVISIDMVEDEFAFLGLMSYLVDQVALMNAAAALCPVEKGETHQWQEWVDPTLAQLSDVRESSKKLVDAARVAATGGLDERARTD